MLQCPPQLISINRGGYFTMPASVLVALPRITKAGNRATRLRGHFGNAAQKILCSSGILIIVSLWLLPCDD